MAINLSTDMCTKVREEAEKDKNVSPIRVRQNGVEVESPGCSSSTGYIINGPTTMRSAIARLPENKNNNCVLSNKPRVTVTSCFVYEVIRD